MSAAVWGAAVLVPFAVHAICAAAPGFIRSRVSFPAAIRAISDSVSAVPIAEAVAAAAAAAAATGAATDLAF